LESRRIVFKFPRLKTFLSVFPIGGSVWGVRGGADEVWRIKLTDERAVRAFGALLPYLDGRMTTDDILAAVEAAGQHRGAAVAVLRQLERSQLLEEADASGLSEPELREFDDQIRFFSRFTQQGGARLQARLRECHVALIGDGALGRSVYERLAGAGVGEVSILSREPAQVARWNERASTPQPQPPPQPQPQPRPRTRVLDLDPNEILPAGAPEPYLLIVCQESHDPRMLEAVDALSRRRRLPWLLVRSLEWQEAWVGPLFVPGETASYRSLEARLQANMTGYHEYRAFDTHVRDVGSERLPTIGSLHAAFDLLASVAVIEAIKFVTEIKVPELLGKFLTINLWTWETELHEVLRVPALDRPDTVRPPVYPWRVSAHGHDTPVSDRA
jgi:bacteriocin biosynthesis cyclodehydratase domain-containing protein